MQNWKDVMGFMVIIMIIAFSISYGIMQMPEPKIHQPIALVTKEGCTIYRWYDKGQRMYYTKCDDGTSPTIAR